MSETKIQNPLCRAKTVANKTKKELYNCTLYFIRKQLRILDVLHYCSNNISIYYEDFMSPLK